jgi:hypothetical protein
MHEYTVTCGKSTGLLTLTNVIRRKISSSRNRRRIMALETMRAATNTVDTASIIQVMIISPSPRSWLCGILSKLGRAEKSIPSMLVVVIS